MVLVDTQCPNLFGRRAPWLSGIDTFQMSSSPRFHTPVAHSHVISPQRTWFADKNSSLAGRIIGLRVVSVLCGPMQKLSYVKITWLAACPSSKPDSALFLQRLFEAPITHTLPVDATNDNDQGLLIRRCAVSFTVSSRMCLSFLKIVFDTWLHLCFQDTICVAPLLSKCRLCFV